MQFQYFVLVDLGWMFTADGSCALLLSPADLGGIGQLTILFFKRGARFLSLALGSLFYRLQPFSQILVGFSGLRDSKEKIPSELNESGTLIICYAANQLFKQFAECFLYLLGDAFERSSCHVTLISQPGKLTK